MTNPEQQIRVPQQKRSIEKKTKIIGAGIELFSKKGFHNTSSTDIANEANVSIGTFYAYFKDKKEVFQEFMNNHFEELVEKIYNYAAEIIPTIKSKRKFLRAILDKFYDVHKNVKFRDAEIMAMKYIDPDMKICAEKNEQDSIARTINLLNHFKSELKLRNIELGSTFLNITVQQVIHYFVFSKNDVPKEKVLDELEDMLYKYLFT